MIMKDILLPVLVVILGDLSIKAIGRLFQPKPASPGVELTEGQLRWQRFLKTANRWATWAVVIVALGTVGYYAIQQQYFPTVEGCIKNGAVAKNVPEGNVVSPLTQGCGYYFDAQTPKGDWFRLSSDSKEIDKTWVARTYVVLRLCKMNAYAPSLWSCITSP